jgi:replicative DNA helicase
MARLKDKVKTVVEHDKDLESCVIASLMIEKPLRVIAFSILPKKAAVFADPIISKVYQVILTLDAEGLDVDMFTVANKLKESAIMPSKEVYPYLGGLCLLMNGFEHFETYCMLIVDMYVRREAQAAKDDYQNSLLDPEQDVASAIETLNKRNAEIAEVYAKRKRVYSAQDLFASILQKSQDASQNPNEVTGIDTGLKVLNQFSAGWQKGHLNIIGARPAMGKTMLMNHFAASAALSGKRVLVFSIEMPKEDIVRRMIASEAKVSSMDIKTGKADFKALIDAVSSLETKHADKLFVDDSGGISIFEVEAKINLIKPDIVFIDYLQIMAIAESNNRRECIEQNSRDLKIIAKKYGISIVVLAQLSRDVEKRGSKIPVMSDLREAGGIEQDGDVIAMLHRPAYYCEGEANEVEKYSNELQLIITKNRDGEVGTIYLHADLRTQTVTDLQPQYNSAVGYKAPETMPQSKIQMPDTSHFSTPF